MAVAVSDAGPLQWWKLNWRSFGTPACGADGVGLTGQIRPTGISRIWALPQGSGQYSLKVAELNVSRDRLVRLMRLENSPAGQPAAASSSDTPVRKAKAEAPAGHATAAGSPTACDAAQGSPTWDAAEGRSSGEEAAQA